MSSTCETMRRALEALDGFGDLTPEAQAKVELAKANLLTALAVQAASEVTGE